MSRTKKPLTEADILSDAIQPGRADLSKATAKALLDLRFSATQEKRLGRLLDKNNAGTLTDGDRLEMERYVRVGNMISLLQAKARLTLRKKPARL
jgi:hypothetical protein